VTAVYSFIAEEKADSSCVWSVAEMCRTLGVSRQGFYDWETRPPSDHQVTDRLLAAEIEAIWECSAHTYGAPRVHAWLVRQGYRCRASGSPGSCARTAGSGSRAVGGCAPPSSTSPPGRPMTWWPATSTRPPRM
jgi:HTH-like domain